MNILQINSGDIGGGAHLVAYNLYKKLNTGKDRCFVLSGEKKSDEKKIIKIASPRFLTYLNLFFGTEYLFYLNTFGISKRRVFKDADIIHYHNLHGYYFNLLAFPYLTSLKPSVWTFHDMWPILGHGAHSFDCLRCESGKFCSEHKDLYPKLYTWDTNPFLYNLKRKLLENSNFRIVVPSLWLKGKVENSFLKDKEITVINNGVDTDVFHPYSKTIKKELKLPSDKTIITFVASGGLTNTWKGIDNIVEVVKYFINDKNKIFVSIGGINEKINFPNLIQIPFLRDRNMLAKYYSASDLFLMMSDIENFPLVSLEAMACGVPVVASNVGGIPEQIEHLKNGYLCNTKSDFINGIVKLTSNKGVLKILSKNAYQKVLEKYTLEMMVKKYKDVYREVINEFKK